MLCVLCLIVLWGFSLVTSYSGVIDYIRLHPIYMPISVQHVCRSTRGDGDGAGADAAAGRARGARGGERVGAHAPRFHSTVSVVGSPPRCASAPSVGSVQIEKF